MGFSFHGWGRLGGGLMAAGSLGLLAAGGAETPAAEPANAPGAKLLAAKPEVLESDYFEVAGPDYASAVTVLQMARALQSNLAKYFAWPEAGRVRAIQVQLVPVAQADFAAPFKVLAEARDGHRIALVRWSAETKFSDVCLAMSSAALEQLVMWQAGPAAAAKTPDWLRIGFGVELEAGLKPAVLDQLAEQAESVPSLTLRQIMTAHGPYGDALPVLEVNAYWLTRFLQEEARMSGTPEKATALFQALAAGTAPVDALRAAFPGEFTDAQTLEMWWAVGYRDLAARHKLPVQSMAQTRAELDGWQSLVIEVAGHDRKVGLEEAWASRALPQTKAAVQEQLDEARAGLPWANPVYYNAVWSLAACLEALRHDDAAAYQAAWKRYQDDRAKAEATEAEVTAAMGG